MDLVLQILPASFKKFSTYIDFEGQHKAERIFQVILSFHGILGFILGYITQQLYITMLSIGIGFIISCLIILPPWPMFRRHQLNWQPNIEKEEDDQKDQKQSKKTSKHRTVSKKSESKKRQ